MNRCGTAEFRQKGSVKINPTEARNGEQPGGNDLAVSDDHDCIGRDLAELRLDFGSANLGRLVNRKFRGQVYLFYWREHDLLPASAGPVRLSEHGGNFEIGLFEEKLQGRNCELRGAAENQAQAPLVATGTARVYHSPSFRSFLILRLMMSRFSMPRCCRNRIPFKWSISWQKARASKFSPRSSNFSPLMSWAFTVTNCGRTT